MKKTFFPLCGLILATVLFRLIPHPPNFTMVGALALFSGSQLNKKTAWVIPLLAMFISDVFLGFHSVILFVYASFMLITLLGGWLKKEGPVYRVFGISLISSIVFFFISNFGVWLMTSLYAKNIGGLINCYTMAVPFFRNTLVSDAFFTVILFYGYQIFFVFLKKLRFSFK